MFVYRDVDVHFAFENLENLRHLSGWPARLWEMFGAEGDVFGKTGARLWDFLPTGTKVLAGYLWIDMGYQCQTAPKVLSLLMLWLKRARFSRFCAAAGGKKATCVVAAGRGIPMPKWHRKFSVYLCCGQDPSILRRPQGKRKPHASRPQVRYISGGVHYSKNGQKLFLLFEVCSQGTSGQSSFE